MGSIEDQINQGVFEFSYLLNGLRQTLERPNQLTTSYTYDNLGRMARISHENSLSQILERFDYTYDVDTIDGTGNPVYKGLRTKRMMTSDLISGTTQHYAYNGQGWLTRAKYIDSASGTEAFTYDATGNRTNRTWTPSIGFPVTSTNFTMALHSDLVTQAGTIGTMDYSVGGNLIDDNWIGREYEWDQFNRVTMVKSATGTPLYGFEYGGTGERAVQNTYSGGLVSSTRAFLYDREDVIAEFSNDTFATIFRRYIHGPGIDEPLAIMGDDVGEYTYYLHDGLGSVTGVVDENGKLGAIEYSAFGETRSNTVKIENRYRYTSREFVETNLYYYRARHMRPDHGRFISMDPLKTIDGTNMFGYVGNDPVMKIDPRGEMIDPSCDCYPEVQKLREQLSWACRSVDSRIHSSCPALKSCIKKKLCKSFSITIYCRYACGGGEMAWGYQSKIFLCTNIPSQELDDVLIHEAAHSCDWQHHDGCGVPFDAGYYHGEEK